MKVMFVTASSSASVELQDQVQRHNSEHPETPPDRGSEGADTHHRQPPPARDQGRGVHLGLGGWKFSAHFY